MVLLRCLLGHLKQVTLSQFYMTIIYFAYKHNSVLLKKQGAKVSAGEAIAIIETQENFLPALTFTLNYGTITSLLTQNNT